MQLLKEQMHRGFYYSDEIIFGTKKNQIIINLLFQSKCVV